MRRITLALTAVALLATAGLGLAATAATAKTGCGVISSKSWGNLWLTKNHRERLVVIRGVSCKTAKRIARDYNHNPSVDQPGGWSCFSSHGSGGHRPSYIYACGKGVTGQTYRHYFRVTWA
jgi:hypothetical protein